MSDLTLKEKIYIIPEHISQSLFRSNRSKYVLDRTEIFLESSRIKIEDLIEVLTLEDEDLEKIYFGNDLDLYEVIDETKTENATIVLLQRKEDQKIFSGRYRIKNGLIVSTLFKEVKNV